MATFRVHLIGAIQALDVDLPVSSIIELHEMASRDRFLRGSLAEPDEEGTCRAVLIPTCRLSWSWRSTSRLSSAL